MNIKSKLNFSVAWLLVCFVIPQPQSTATQEQIPRVRASVGLREVVAVEAKASRIKELEAEIEKDRLELLDLEEAWKAKVNRLKQELAELYSERDAALRELRTGFYCDKCWRTKTEIEKQENETFEQHLGRVRSNAVPAPENKVEEKKEMFRLKIAAKNREIEAIGEGDKSVLAKRRKIEQSKSKIESLCEEITAHSKAYERVIAGEVKELHNSWARILMDHASNILVGKDRIVIYQGRIAAYRKELEERSIQVREEVAKQNAGEQKKRKDKILRNEREPQALEAAYQESIGPLEKKLSEVKAKLDEINSKLEKTDLDEDMKKSLTDERAQLLEQAAAIEKEIRDYKSAYESKVSSLQNEITQLLMEIGQLHTGLLKQQDDAVAALKMGYDQKITEAERSIDTAASDLNALRKVYTERVGSYDKTNDEYYQIVSSESDRMALAGRELNCPVWNQARGLIARNWNDLLPCVNTITTMSKPYSTHVFGSYCPSVTAPSNLFSYKSFLMSLDDDDRKLIRENSNVNWFEALFK